MVILTYTTPTFISEMLCLVTYVCTTVLNDSYSFSNGLYSTSLYSDQVGFKQEARQHWLGCVWSLEIDFVRDLCMYMCVPEASNKQWRHVA